MSRPPKRPRNSVYVDRVDIGIDDIDIYSDISVREGRLNKSGKHNVIEPLPTREPVRDVSEAWMSLTAWRTDDDSTFALDPADGRLYDEAVEREVMDDTPSASSAETVSPVARKTYACSRVSVCTLVLHKLDCTFDIFLRKGHTSCGRMCTGRPISQR